MGGMTDRNGIDPIKKFAHVKITHPRHQAYGQTGTVVRIDPRKRRVWVALADSRIVPAGHRSVEVLMPRNARVVK